LEVVHVSVELPPRRILKGLPVKVSVGAGGGGGAVTVMVTFLTPVLTPALFLHSREYVLVAGGITVRFPSKALELISHPFVAVQETAFVVLHRKVALSPVVILKGSPVKVSVGAGTGGAVTAVMVTFLTPVETPTLFQHSRE
jgi:hypothetical protein